MHHRDAFVNAILASPEDDALRLIYADWLGERGNPSDGALADFIRTQVELYSLSDDDPRRPRLEDQEHELLSRNESHWLGNWPRYLPHWRFERGFLSEIQTDTSTLVEYGADLFTRHPITRLLLQPEDAYEPGPAEEVGAANWLSRLTSLRLDGWHMHVAAAEPILTSSRLTGLSELDAAQIEDDGYFPALLARCPSVARLRIVGVPGVPGDPAVMVEALESTKVEDLSASGVFVNDAALAALLRSRFARRLTGLRAFHGEFGPDAWRAFESTSLTGSLRRLDIAESPLAGSGLAPLLALPGLRNLKILKVSSDTAPPEGLLEAIAASSFWTNAVEFESRDIPFQEASFAVLCGQSQRPPLKKLDIMGSGIRRGARYIWAAPFAESLTELGLGRCGLSDDELASLSESGRCTLLRSLDLRGQDGNGITDAGILRLAAAPALARLRSLNLYKSHLTAKAVDALLNGGSWRLADLNLGNCGLTRDAVSVLAASPAIARLRSLNLTFNKALQGDALLPLAESPYLSPLCDLTADQISTRTQEALLSRLGRHARSVYRP
jgi:uncharacterized protein (TIGR02996 family)